MANNRFALIVANSKYKDEELKQLAAPAADADSLAWVLKHPSMGGFEVQLSVNEPSHIVNRKIEAFFTNRNFDDTLLFYFSGHGVKDEDGLLYFATTNTTRKLLDSTAIASRLIHKAIRRSQSKRQILILDCCYSGAFPRGMITRSDEKVGTKEIFKEGRGCVILAASDAMQYAFEGDHLEKKRDECSVFTHHLVRGLETGEADLNNDGQIMTDELYKYVHEQVRRENPNQTPERWVLDVQGDIVVAQNPHIDEKGNRREMPILKYKEAFAGIVLASAASDGYISDNERRYIEAILLRMQLFKGCTEEEYQRMSDNLTEILDNQGYKALLEMSIKDLPSDLYKTVFIASVDLLAIDGNLTGKEQEFLSYLEKKLQVEPEFVRSVLPVIYIKNKG